MGKSCKTFGLKHFHIPLDGANQPLLSNKKIQSDLKKNLTKLYNYLQTHEERVLLHCAAGIHRTGICTYTLLRWTGLSPKESFDVIKGVRIDTANGVGEWRIQLAEKHIVA